MKTSKILYDIIVSEISYFVKVLTTPSPGIFIRMQDLTQLFYRCGIQKTAVDTFYHKFHLVREHNHYLFFTHSVKALMFKLL